MLIQRARDIICEAMQWQPLTVTPLPYGLNALEPCMSRHCVDVHYNKLTKRYFTKYNKSGDLFQKAGALLHDQYYWPLMQPYSKNNLPSEDLEQSIHNVHVSVDNFKEKILQSALSVQGNGWVLIMKDLQIQTVQNHVLPAQIACAIDIWEHATVDYDYDREKFLDHYWNVINWSKLEQALNEKTGY
jgi:Fe-Mn family superoxide dismutase